MSEPTVGRVYRFDEEDYRFGAGPLLVRVTRVVDAVDFGDGARVDLWWQVEAICRPPAVDGPGQPRQLYLRAAAVDR